MPKRIIVIDSQRLNSVQLCARRYDFEFNQDQLPRVKPDYFEKGDLMHRMCEMYYNMRRYSHNWAKNNYTHDNIVEICQRYGSMYSAKLELDAADSAECVYQFGEYTKFYQNDGWRPIAVEQAGALTLYEDDELQIIIEFRIDLIVESDNGPVVVDHKYVSRRTDPTVLNNQFLLYLFATGTNNLILNRIGKQKTLKPVDRFQRPFFSVSKDLLVEWAENTVDWVGMLMHYEATSHWPANFTSCDKFGGCVFQAVCTTERAARAWKLEQEFKRREMKWDVGAKL